MWSGFLSTKEGGEEKKKTVEKITRKESPGLRRHACGIDCGTSPSPHLLIKAGGRGTAESPPLTASLLRAQAGIKRTAFSTF
jgi:hypothetical protein